MSLPSISSLPSVSDDTIKKMQEEADKKLAQDNIKIEEPVEQKHPMLADHQELKEEESSQAEAVIEEKTTEQPKNTAQQESFKSLRQQKLRAEQERDELLRQLEANRDKTVTQEPEEEVSIDADALVEGKHLSKVAKEIKKLKQELNQYKQQSALSATEIRLKQQYPDFDAIVSADNVSQLREQYPEIAASINANQDIYSKAVSAYTMIKKLGVAPEPDTYQDDKIKAQKNLAKPRPSISLSPQQGDSPLSKANAFAEGLTDDLKKQLWKEMNTIRKTS